MKRHHAPLALAAAALALAGCAGDPDPATSPAADTATEAICHEGASPAPSPCADETDDSTGSETPGTPTAAPTTGDTPEMAGMCAAGEPDCEDMIPFPPPSGMPADGGAGTCLAGATECADIPGGEAPGPPAPEQATKVEPREGLVDTRSIPWASVVPVDGDQTMLEVAWWSGNQACNGLDRIDVEETDEVVTITVFAGRDPDNEICTEEALLVSSVVELSTELGPRSIADGADGPGS